MGLGDVPKGAAPIALADFLKEVKDDYLKKNQDLTDFAKAELKRMEDRYQPSKGVIVKNPDPKGNQFTATRYVFYPNRDAPKDDVKGLARLRGHLRKGEWLTKFRKVIRKDEMTDDLVLEPVPGAEEQSYVRILPTSPP